MAVRTWAREQGIDIKVRGQVPADIVAKYRAHPLIARTDRPDSGRRDGRTLANGSTEGLVRLKTLDVNKAIQRICATTNTPTPSAWKR